MTRAQVDDWRAGHQLDPLTDREWIRKYAPGPQQMPLPFPESPDGIPTIAV